MSLDPSMGCKHYANEVRSQLTFKFLSILIKIGCFKGLTIYMKKLLESDWLRAVQFKCNTSAKSATPVQITYRNSEL